MPETAPAKEPCYLRSERSPAFTRFCEAVYGRMLNQYGTADMEQLDLLVGALALGPGERALDAGCGTGLTTEYLATATGASFTGVDNVARAIERARQRAESRPDRLSFVVGTMDALDLPARSFDAIVAVESLYFPKDLTATIRQFKDLLRPGGRMGLFFTHFGGKTATPSETRLGQSLALSGLPFEAHDLTEQDRRFWRRAKEVGESLLAEAEVEGNADLLHLGETQAVLDLIDKGGHARYLYLVRAA
jgi:ubiquinone/menaquinone biosynthesis C-methylase UbiE